MSRDIFFSSFSKLKIISILGCGSFAEMARSFAILSDKILQLCESVSTCRNGRSPRRGGDASGTFCDLYANLARHKHVRRAKNSDWRRVKLLAEVFASRAMGNPRWSCVESHLSTAKRSSCLKERSKNRDKKSIKFSFSFRISKTLSII